MSEHDQFQDYSMVLEWEPRDRIFVATVPELPGCSTHGMAYEDSVQHGEEAIESWINASRHWGLPIPKPRVGLDALPDFIEPDHLTYVPPGEPIEYDHYSLDIIWQPDDMIYVVTVRELRGCRTHGSTHKEAVIQGRDVIESWISAFRSDRRIPRPKYYDLEPAETAAVRRPA